MGARATRPRMIVGVASRWLLHQMAQDQIRRFPADRVNTAKKEAQAKGGPCGARLLDLAWTAWRVLGSSLSDLLGRLPACALSAELADGAGPGWGVQGC